MSQQDVKPFSKLKSTSKKLKIAYFKNTIESDQIDTTIQSATFDYIEKLKQEGHELAALDFEFLDYLIPAYYVLTTAEASSNLSRYDGVRFGYRSAEPKSLSETYRKSRTEGFGDEVKRRIMLGTFVLSSGYYDAYYTKAQKVRRLISDYIKKVFENHDLIVMPVTPDVAWSIGENDADPIKTYLADVYTVLANMVGIPAISFPLGKKDDLPFGIQVMSPAFEEDKLLNFAFTQAK